MADLIRTLLTSVSRADVLLGVEEALQQDDKYIDELLSGVSLASWSSRGVHELTFPKLLTAPDDRYSLQVEGFLRIAGASNSKRAQALRAKLSKVQLLGTDRRWTWGKVTYRPVDLDQLAGLPVKHLEVLNARGVPCSIELGHVTHCELIDCHLDELPAMPELTTLVVRDGKLPRLDVSRFPKLQSLSVQGVQDLPGIEGVSGLPLTDVSLAGLPATPDLTGVKTLKRLDLSVGKADTVRFESRNLRELSLTLAGSVPLPELQCTKLQSLSLTGSSATDLSALSGVAEVSSLSLQDMDHMTSLDGLIDYGTLHVRNLPKLVRVRGGRHITRLSLQSCESLVDLDGLGPCPKLTRFDGWNCTALTSIGGLSKSPALTQISISGMTSLKSVEGLGACTELSDLQFIGCRGSGLDLMPLDGLTKIKRIRCTRTSIGKTRIPGSLHGVVVPKSLVTRRTRAASDKPLPKQARGTARKQVAKLKKLMFSRDFDRMDQCAELVGALDSDEVATALAGGSKLERAVDTVSLLPKTQTSAPGIFRGPYDRLVPNRYFESGDILKPYRGHGLLALAARVPDESSLAALREAEGLVLVGRSKRWEKTPVRVWPLGSFENLRRVGIFCASEIEDAELFEDCEQLEELALYGVDGIETLGALTGAPQLKTLRVEQLAGTWTLGSEDGLARLEALEIQGGWRSSFQMDEREVRSLRSLRELSLAGVQVTEAAFRMLGRLPGLESLEVLSCRENDLTPVANLTRLKHLSIDSYSSSTLALSGLDGLESLRLQGFHSQSVERLRGLPVAKLELLHCGQLTGWGALEGVEELLLTGYRWRKAKELDGLGWDGLKTVRVHGKRLPATHVNRLTKAGVTVENVGG